MANSMEDKVVSLSFENEDFEKNAKTSLETLEKLKEATKFDDKTNGLDKLGESAKNVDLESLRKSTTGLSESFNALDVIASSVLFNIANKATEAAEKLMYMFTIEPVTTGFSEYENKINSTLTIMSSTGDDIEVVKDRLAALDEYADRTIYKLEDMTSNIGKFTNAGVGLDESIVAMEGIANLAALSGANAQQASHAMYNLSQALSMGYLGLMDWKSIENANMATKTFKEELIATAEAMGTLEKQEDGWVSTTTNAQGKVSKIFDATSGFRESLNHQWITNDVLIATLQNFNEGMSETGDKAFEAATKVKTFTQMMDTLKEAAQTGWSESFTHIIGDEEEAAHIWTTVSDGISSVIGWFDNLRNTALAFVFDSPFEKIMTMASGLGMDMRVWEDTLTGILERNGVDVEALRDKYKTLREAIQDGTISKDIFKQSIKEAFGVIIPGIDESTTAVEGFEEAVLNVIKGTFGNGEERINALTEAGYNAKQIQDEVNAIWERNGGNWDDLTLTEKGAAVATETLTGKVNELKEGYLAFADAEDKQIDYNEKMKEGLDKLEPSLGRASEIIDQSLQNNVVETFDAQTAAVRQFLSDMDDSTTAVGKLFENLDNLGWGVELFDSLAAGIKSVGTFLGAVGAGLGMLALDPLVAITDAFVGFKNFLDGINFTESFLNGVTLATGMLLQPLAVIFSIVTALAGGVLSTIIGLLGVLAPLGTILAGGLVLIASGLVSLLSPLKTAIPNAFSKLSKNLKDLSKRTKEFFKQSMESGTLKRVSDTIGLISKNLGIAKTNLFGAVSAGWAIISGKAAGAFDGVYDSIVRLTNWIGNNLNAGLEKFNVWLTNLNWDSITVWFENLGTKITDSWDKIKGSFDWKVIGDGLLSVFGLIGNTILTTIGLVGALGASLISMAANSGILTFFGDTLTKIGNFAKENLTFDKVSESFNSLKNSLKNFFAERINLESLSETWGKFKTTVGDFFDLISSHLPTMDTIQSKFDEMLTKFAPIYDAYIQPIVDKVGGAISNTIDWLDGAIKHSRTFGEFVDIVKRKLHDMIDDWGKSVFGESFSIDGIIGYVTSIKNTIVEFLQKIFGEDIPAGAKSFLDKVTTFLQGGCESISQFMEKVAGFFSDNGGIKLISTASLFLFIRTIISLFISLITITSSVNDIKKSVKGFASMIDLIPYLEKMKMFNESLKIIVASVVILAAVIAALSQVPNLDKGLEAITRIGIFYIALMAMITYMSSNAKLGNLTALAGVMIGLGLAVAAIAGAFLVILIATSIFKKETIQTAVDAVIALMAGMALLIFGMSLIPKGSLTSISIAGTGMFAIAASILAMALAFAIIADTVNGMSPGDIFATVVVMAALIGGIIAIMKLCNGMSILVGGGASLIGVLAFVVALAGVIFAIYALSIMPFDLMISGIKKLAVVVLTLLGITYLFSQIGSANIGGFAGLFGLAVAIGILVGVIFALSVLSPGDVAKAVIVIGALALIVSIGSAIMGNTFANMGAAARMMAFAACIGVLTLCVMALTMVDLGKAFVAAVILSGTIAALSKCLSIAGELKGSAKNILAFAVCIGVLAGSLYILATLDIGKLLVSAISLAGVMYLMTKCFTIIGAMRSQVNVSTLAKFAIMIGVLAGTLILLEKFTDADKLLKVAEAMGIMAVVFAAIGGTLGLIAAIPTVNAGKIFMIGAAIEALIAILAAGIVVIDKMGWMDDLEQAFEKLGRCFGAFRRGMDAARLEGIDTEALDKMSEVIPKLNTAFDGFDESNSTKVDSFSKFLEALASLSAAEIQSQEFLGMSVAENGLNNLTEFADGLKNDLLPLMSFTEEDAARVGVYGDILGSLGDAASKIPETGSLTQTLVTGNHDLSDFAKGVKDLGEALKAMEENLPDTGEDGQLTISKYMDVIQSLADISAKVNEGTNTWLAFWTGETPWGELGKGLNQFADCFIDFNSKMSGITLSDNMGGMSSDGSGSGIIGILDSLSQISEKVGDGEDKWFKFWTGTTMWGEFAKGVGDLAGSLPPALEILSGETINDTGIQNMEKMVGFISSLSQSGATFDTERIDGIYGWITGKTEWTAFTQSLADLAEGMPDFMQKISTLPTDTDLTGLNSFSEAIGIVITISNTLNDNSWAQLGGFMSSLDDNWLKITTFISNASSLASSDIEQAKTNMTSIKEVLDAMTNGGIREEGTNIWENVSESAGQIIGQFGNAINSAENVAMLQGEFKSLLETAFGNAVTEVTGSSYFESRMQEMQEALKPKEVETPTIDISSIESVSSTISSEASSAKSAASEFSGVGENITSGIVGGVNSDSITGAVTAAVNAAKTAANAISFFTVGFYISTGMASGVRSGGGSLTAAVRDIVRQGLAAGKQEAQVGSPSKLFRDELGFWLPAGMATGVEKGGYLLNDALTDTVDNGLNSVRGAIGTASGIIQNGLDDLTIRPLVDLSGVHDGLRAMASSIEGYNFATSVGLRADAYIGARYSGNDASTDAIVQAIKDLDTGGTTNVTTINGLTYGDDSQPARLTQELAGFLLQEARA